MIKHRKIISLSKTTYRYRLIIKKIYTDIIEKKFPNNKEEYLPLLEKNKFSAIEIIELNKKIFGKNSENREFDQNHRSYSKSDILQMLDFQKKHNLSNSELAKHFGISRNSVTKWKKIFLV